MTGVLLKAYCPMEHRRGKPPATTTPDGDVLLELVLLPGDPVHDAWVCTSDKCSWFIVVPKGEQA